MTKLDILNGMLGAVGESSVNSITSTHPTAVAARKLLDRIIREVQNIGWWFNREYDIEVSPEAGSGYILLPANTLKADPVDQSSSAVQRGTKMYDVKNKTYVFTEPLRMNFVLELPIEELPYSAASYIEYLATYRFYIRDDGDLDKAQELKSDAMMAWVDLRKEELRASDVNSNSRPSVIMLRGPMRQAGYGINPLYPGGGE